MVRPVVGCPGYIGNLCIRGVEPEDLDGSRARVRFGEGGFRLRTPERRTNAVVSYIAGRAARGAASRTAGETPGAKGLKALCMRAASSVAWAS